MLQQAKTRDTNNTAIRRSQCRQWHRRDRRLAAVTGLHRARPRDPSTRHRLQAAADATIRALCRALGPGPDPYLYQDQDHGHGHGLYRDHVRLLRLAAMAATEAAVATVARPATALPDTQRFVATADGLETRQWEAQLD